MMRSIDWPVGWSVDRLLGQLQNCQLVNNNLKIRRAAYRDEIDVNGNQIDNNNNKKNTCKYMELMYDVEKESEEKHQQIYEKGNACKRRAHSNWMVYMCAS